MVILSQIFETGAYWDTYSFILYVSIGIVYALLVNASVKPLQMNKSPAPNPLFALLAFLWFSFFLAFRDASVGSDSYAYVNMFLMSTNVDIDWQNALVFKTYTEPLYLLLESAVRSFTDSYTVFFTVKASIISGSLTYFFLTFFDRRQSCLPIMLAAIYFEFAAAIARSALGMSLFLIALCLVKKEKKVTPIMFAALACYFHNSLVVMMPLFVVLSVRHFALRLTKRQLCAAILLLAVLINVSIAPLSGIVQESKYGIYYGSTTITLFSVWNVLILAFALIANWRKVSKACDENSSDTVAVLAFLYEVICLPLVIGFGLWRMTTYFLPIRCVVWGIILREWREHSLSSSEYVVVALFMFLAFLAACLFYLGRESAYFGFVYSFVF